MVRYLIQRPVAVLMMFIALVIAGLFLIKKVPVSLLPDVDVPEIIIRINYPNTAAAVLDRNIVEPVRESLLNLDNLQSIESRSANHTAYLHLTFEYGTRMNLAYIEVNEKIDQLSGTLPRDMPRPQVMRINTSDIPVIRLQVIPGNEDDYGEISSLAQKILKKRIEQVEGVSLVDINGTRQNIISITPDRAVLTALGIDESFITAAIQNSNRELGGLSVKDGQYRYFVKLENVLEDISAIAALPVRLKDGSVIPLKTVAGVEEEPEKQTGYHLFNGKEGLVITIQKQPGSKMNDLVPKIKDAVNLFRKDYPQATFDLTQDQTFLLDAGISNLKQDLLYGGILTVLLLFMFLGNWASPSLMSISIPLSLIITFIFFYLFNISFNIISLSGLALGVGMLIDNSIVVIDNITRKRREGLSMTESSVEGTNEVITPVISQVLTTIAVYAPLILLSGMAGALITDQAIGLTISLGVSLLVAFVLAPLLYKIFLKTPPEKLKEDTFFFQSVSRAYHRMIRHILRHKLVYFLFTLLIMPVGFWLAGKIPVSSLPKIEKKESLIMIDWNEPVDAQENLQRTRALLTRIQPSCTVTESETGIKQFLLQQDNNTIQQTEIYFSCKQERDKLNTDILVRDWVQKKYPAASLRIIDAPNAFTQLFTTSSPYFEARFKPVKSNTGTEEFTGLDRVLKKIPADYIPGAGIVTERSITVSLNNEKMALYGVSRQVIDEALKQQFGTYTISEIKQFGDIRVIRLKTGNNSIESKLSSIVKGISGTAYPLNYFLSVNNDQQAKFITSDKSGHYKSIIFKPGISGIKDLEKKISGLAMQEGFTAEFSGSYYTDRQQLKNLRFIFLLVLILLYFILAIQYESLVQPIVVMLTIPLGITGGMFLLWITGGTLDVMAAIGFIVILGLIVDDPILKIETLNRLEKKYLSQGLKHDDRLLERMIHEAGDICLKPLLMVSLTTSIALVPVLFVGGIGNDLQKPLSVVIIGGLTIGTFFTTWFIPLAYWYVTKWKNKIIK